MNWRTKPTDLVQLQNLFKERLTQMAEELYARPLADGLLLPADIQGDTERFFQRKRTSLQEFYSYYQQQWEYYRQMEDASESDFIHFLHHTAYPFSQRYDMLELNVHFYIEQMDHARPHTDDRRRIRNLFMEKWHRLLSDREFDYHLQQIDSLCHEYTLARNTDRDSLLNTGQENTDLANRLEWLAPILRPEERNKLKELASVMRKNPIVQELCKTVGRRKSTARKIFKATAGYETSWQVHPSSASDITGISMGNDLNALLPIEYCYLSQPELEPLFQQRFNEHKLQIFDSTSRIRRRIQPTRKPGNDVSKPNHEGPVVICVDTSGSMSGGYETIAKAIVLAMAMLAERQSRRCSLILFSDQIDTIEIDSMYASLPELAEFMVQSFSGGTDIYEAIKYASARLAEEAYSKADLLIMSDFQMKSPDPETLANLNILGSKNCNIYSVAFGRSWNDDYLNLCDKVWYYQ